MYIYRTYGTKWKRDFVCMHEGLEDLEIEYAYYTLTVVRRRVKKEGKHDSSLVRLEPKSRLNGNESRHYFKCFQREPPTPGCSVASFFRN